MKTNGLLSIKTVLISVSDKNGVKALAQKLSEYKVKIISTGGTAKKLRGAGIEVTDVINVTGHPECLGGRVKTLHPKIHGGLLGLRNDSGQAEEMRRLHIEPIDMVAVNLYPFEATIAKEGITMAEAIEQIDIGGPAMIRSGSKNFRDVVVVTNPDQYQQVIRELDEHDGCITLKTRVEFAIEAFRITGFYDRAIRQYLSDNAYDLSTLW